METHQRVKKKRSAKREEVSETLYIFFLFMLSALSGIVIFTTATTEKCNYRDSKELRLLLPVNETTMTARNNLLFNNQTRFLTVTTLVQ